ncbi:hypothetical protein Syncc8109_0446 [Synechococcus sp. WH 8109]|nr:hypothetical protein Syncc8109_0446 [Synechococcus sp. WH 8109]
MLKNLNLFRKISLQQQFLIILIGSSLYQLIYRRRIWLLI